MKNISLKFLTLITGLLFLTSCVLDQDRVDFGEGPVIVQFQKSSDSKSFIQKGDGQLVDLNIVLESFGGDNLPTTSPVTVTVGVAAESQAKEGEEIVIPTKTITIPAGKNSANLLVRVDPEELTVGTPTKLVLEIVSASQTISNGKHKITVELKAICDSDLAGEYTYTNGSKKPVTITATGTGTYRANRDNAFVSDYYFDFSDNCGNLTITGGYLEDAGVPISGTGTVDPVTGTITIKYTAEGYFENRTMIMTKN